MVGLMMGELVGGEFVGYIQMIWRGQESSGILNLEKKQEFLTARNSCEKFL
jgi:hypothetical protein